MKQIDISNNGFISQDITDCLVFLHAIGVMPNLVICGSLGLVLNGKLHRKVEDIDMLTIYDWYGCDNRLQMYADHGAGQVSHKFNVDGIHISCWKIRLFGIKIDLLYNHSMTLLDTEEAILILDDNIKIPVRIEKPEVAISFKKKYLIADYSEENRKKHLADIDSMEGDPVKTFKSPPPKKFVEATANSTDDDLPF